MLVRGSFDEQRNMRFVSSGCNTSRSPHSSASISKFVHACMPSHFSHVRLSVIIWAVAWQAPWPWDSSNKNTGVGCHALLQGIFPTQGSNLRLPASPALQKDSLPTEPPSKSISKFTEAVMGLSTCSFQTVSVSLSSQGCILEIVHTVGTGHRTYTPRTREGWGTSHYPVQVKGYPKPHPLCDIGMYFFSKVTHVGNF